MPWWASMSSNTLTFRGRLPGATPLPNQARGAGLPAGAACCVVCVVVICRPRLGAAGHLAQVLRRGAELHLLDLVEGEADALELAGQCLGVLGVVDVDDGALRQVDVGVHEGGVLA